MVFKGLSKLQSPCFKTIYDTDIVLELTLVSIPEACEWASHYLNRDIKSSNLEYLIQYSKISKYHDRSGNVCVSLDELKDYYDHQVLSKKERWKSKLGNDIDWQLSFEELPESERTKHVHRLHPYKGKFIPQLVQYFLDDHTDDFKNETYFSVCDTVLDPFMGSGTTLVQASEMGINSIGIDISEFNCLIANVKTDIYDMFTLKYKLDLALSKLEQFSSHIFNDGFDNQLRKRISEYNRVNFPAREYKKLVNAKMINEDEYSTSKLEEFFKINSEFIEMNETVAKEKIVDQNNVSSFISKWFTKRIRQELSFYIDLINKEQDLQVANVMKIILSRTARSCRATTHSDLATLIQPQYLPYYCHKHYKICTPIDSIIKHLKKNTMDTVERLKAYSKLRREGVKISIIHGDSRNVDIKKSLEEDQNQVTAPSNWKVDGVFTSPPYVGQIDYHEQHAYSYEMFNIPREDEKEIGPMFKGKNETAKNAYIEDISSVLLNISRFVKDDGNYFIVANDQYNLYPKIAKKSGLEIIQVFKRPVLNRTERDRQPYAEFIFHMRKK